MVAFLKDIEEAVFLDPTNHFKEIKIPIEKRVNPLTGKTGRVLPFPFQLPEAKDLQPIIEQSVIAGCPFCSDTIDRDTPKFLPHIAREGRIALGEAIVMPNLFPYERYSAVTRLTETHFVPLDDFSVQCLMDGLVVSLDYFNRIRRNDPDANFGSINWNYMPPAGSGLVHPHFQPFVNSSPTRYMEKIAKGSARYLRDKGRIFWDDYVQEEEKQKIRFIGRSGSVSFLTPFVPGNMMGEVWAVFDGQNTVAEDTETYFHWFAEGLSRILQGIYDMNFTSLNMALNLFFQPQEGVRTLARITPRALIPPLDTADLNYYEKLHGETLCVVSPEDLASHLRPYF